MEYKLEDINTKIGSGVRIENAGKIYEQINCEGEFYARIMKAPHMEFESTNQKFDEHRGILFNPSLKYNQKCYDEFKTITDRLQQVSGEEFSNSANDFIRYMSYSGLEKELKNVPSTVKIHIKSKKIYYEKINYWLNSKSRPWGFLSSAAIFAAGFPSILNLDISPRDFFIVFSMYSTTVPIMEAAFGVIPAMESKYGWCGPLYALGFLPTRGIYKKKLEKADYMLDKFIKDYVIINKVNKFTGDKNKLSKQNRLAEKHLGILEELFPYTSNQKGFSITYSNPDRERVVNFFDYLLNGGNVPQLQSPNTAKEKAKIEKKEDKPNFINPWEINIPKMKGERENE
jgi:hypothetical protein